MELPHVDFKKLSKAPSFSHQAKNAAVVKLYRDNILIDAPRFMVKSLSECLRPEISFTGPKRNDGIFLKGSFAK
jgi:hypothetical protein